MRATRSSWTTQPLPPEREELGFEATFSHAEAELLMLGFIPAVMEDKWFIFWEDGWLYFRRSWTGMLIYVLQLETMPDGLRVAASWVNRNPEQYAGQDLAHDRAIVHSLIHSYLFQRDAP